MPGQINVRPILGNEYAVGNQFKDKKVALFYDHTIKHTTGLYVKKALGRLCHVNVFHPLEIKKVAQNYDLYLVVDDGSHYIFPHHLKPSAFWAIDTHLTISNDLIMAMNFDYIFCAQRNGAIQLRKYGFKNIEWLPLACDPDVHHHGPVEKIYDVGFVGNLWTGFRRELLCAIKSKYSNSCIGRADYTDIGKIYAKSRVVFNISVRNDLNMRVFEGLCSGSALLTDKIDNIEDIFIDNQDLFLFSSKEEALSKIDYLLKNTQETRRVSDNGYQKVIKEHTYLNRAKAILYYTLTGIPRPNRLNTILSIVNRYLFLKKLAINRYVNAFVFLPWIDFTLFRAKLREQLLRQLYECVRAPRPGEVSTVDHDDC